MRRARAYGLSARVRAGAAIGVAVCLLCGAFAGGADEAQELAQLRARLATLKEELSQTTAERDAESARLRDTELQRTTASARLEALRGELREGEQRLASIRRERRAQEAALAAERSRLAQAVRAAYFGGGQERLKLLLGEDDPGQLARMLVYEAYVARSRADRVQSVREHLDRIAQLERDADEGTKRLQAVEEERSKELSALERARTERTQAIAALEKRAHTQSESIQELQGRERTLVDLIDRLHETLSDFPVQGERPFSALRGRLAWPVNGRLLADYGDLRAGAGLRWSGVLLGAERGAEVHAIANGRVAFADWLPGLGLLIIVDHGDGYLSLYGHNDTLRKSAGDWVRPGDVLATVGDTGGQSRPALYFEIRRGKTPQDPHPWFQQKLARR
jgi:septal ring factor EnvC (AmiA/AmiB activator)